VLNLYRVQFNKKRAEQGMAEEVDLRYLSQLLAQLEEDMRPLKSDMAETRASGVRVRSGLASLKADVSRVETTLDDFREAFARRFDRMDDSMKSGFEMLCARLDAQIKLFNARSDQINAIPADVNSSKQS
jgi:outer membrane protein TolC